ncbi:MAG: GTPase domain-containing protein [Patescibacteria group bacterium]|nr:GTPase domain-containing protein [Patescibacteria group bacterium]
MIFDHENKILQVKIVYYGPGMAGKTTSVRYLFSCFDKEDSLKSIESTVGRTLFFDFGVLKFKGAIWDLKLLVYSATGQDFYAGTRPATLNGVSGIIFVADSQKKCLEHNIRSWNELNTLFEEEIYNIPIVISLNKYDIENSDKINENEFLNKINYNLYNNLDMNRTVAINGTGVLEAFNKLLRFIFPQINIQIAVIN